MGPLSKEKRDRLILVVVGTLMIVGALWFLVIKSRNAQITDTRAALVKANDELKRARTAVEQADQTKAEVEAESQKLRDLEEAMAVGDPYTWARELIMQKFRVGHEAVYIADVARPTEGKAGVLADFPYSAITFTVRGSAFYHDFGRFLANFENQHPYFHVRNVGLNTTPEGGAIAEATTSRGEEEKLYFRMDVVALVRP